MRSRRSDETTDRPGLIRTVRVDRRVDQLVTRANPGDIAVIDVADLDRGTADQLLSAGVSAVVNASSSSSGRYPVNGARALLDAGVVLVDDVGGEVFSRVRDGDTVRLDGATVYAAGEPVVDGRLQSDETVRASTEQARADFRERLGAFVADAGRRIAEDDGSLLEGDGFPVLVTELDGRIVLVVTAGATADELAVARRLRRRRDALVVAVGTGADLARDAKLGPDLLVIGRGAVPREGYAKVREVLVLDHADADAPVPTGTPRAHTRSLGSAEDTAVLLAHARGAALVVTVGLDESLAGLLDRSATAGSAPFVSRLRADGREISTGGASTAFGRLRRSRRGTVGVVAGLALALVVGAGAAVLATRDDDTTGSGSTASASGSQARGAQAFAGTIAPALVAGRLEGHVVTVVALPGVDPRRISAVTSALGSAGAAVSEPVVIGPDYLAPRSTRMLRDLAVQLAPTALRQRIQAQPPTTAPAAQLDEIVASTLADQQVSSVGTADPAATTVLTGLARLSGITAMPQRFSAGDLVVVLVPAASTTDVAARTTAFAKALAAQARGVAVVSLAAANPKASTGAVRALRSAARPKNLTTVDDGATPLGEVSGVLSLALVLAGHRGGDFGAASDATAPVPIAAAAKAKARAGSATSSTPAATAPGR